MDLGVVRSNVGLHEFWNHDQHWQRIVHQEKIPAKITIAISISPSYEYQTDSTTIFSYEIRKLTSIYATVDKNNHPNKWRVNKHNKKAEQFQIAHQTCYDATIVREHRCCLFVCRSLVSIEPLHFHNPNNPKFVSKTNIGTIFAYGNCSNSFLWAPTINLGRCNKIGKKDTFTTQWVHGQYLRSDDKLINTLQMQKGGACHLMVPPMLLFQCRKVIKIRRQIQYNIL